MERRLREASQGKRVVGLRAAEGIRAPDLSSGPDFIALPKHNILLGNLLLSRNEQDTSHKLYL